MSQPDVKTALFHAELGQYLDCVSDADVVGVCTSCIAVRRRDEVDQTERCPASILETGLASAESARKHTWRAFTDRDELEGFLREHAAQVKSLAEEAVKALGVEG